MKCGNNFSRIAADGWEWKEIFHIFANWRLCTGHNDKYTGKKMTFSKNIRIIIAAAISVAAAVSCKKDNTDEEMLPSLSGQLRFEMESYAFENESITVTPSGVSHPEGRGF